ncbi:hypothetical protein JCM10450v2_004918 [Rhodotorula kratochvilovae]
MPSSPSTSSIHRLPQELLKLIAAFVHQKDQATVNSEVYRQSFVGAPGGDDDGAEVSPFVQWTKGISALSLVNKRFRSAASPFLAKTVNACQLADPLLRFGGIPQSVLDGVEKLTLHDASNDDFIEGILALGSLRKLKTIVVSERATEHAFLLRITPIGPLARPRLVAGTNQVVELELEKFHYGMREPARWVRPFARPASLRRLRLGAPPYHVTQHWPEAEEELAQLLMECSQLVQLEVAEYIDERCGFFAAVAGPEGDETRVVLPALESLEVSLLVWAFPPFIPRLAPNLTSLSLDIELLPHDEPEEEPEQGIHSPHFSAHRTLDGECLFSPSVELRSGLAITLDLPRLMVLEHRAALERRCAEAGASLRIERSRDPLAPFVDMADLLREDGFPDAEDDGSSASESGAGGDGSLTGESDAGNDDELAEGEEDADDDGFSASESDAGNEDESEKGEMGVGDDGSSTGASDAGGREAEEGHSARPLTGGAAKLRAGQAELRR